MSRILFLLLIIFLSNNSYSQCWDYDTISNKNIKKILVYTKWVKNSIEEKDSSLSAIQYFDRGLKTKEIIYDCDSKICNDTLWYYYDYNSRLAKVIIMQNYAGEYKRTIFFDYDKRSDNFKRTFIDIKKDTSEICYINRIYDNKDRLVCKIDSTITSSNLYEVYKNYYVYDTYGKLLKTITYTSGLYRGDYDIIKNTVSYYSGGPYENMKFKTDGLDYQPGHNKGILYCSKQGSVETIAKNNLIIKEIFYFTYDTKETEKFRIDYYYYYE